MPFQTEFSFTLPRGYLDPDGDLHREEVMRLATAADEILPMKDPRVQANPAYLTAILLSRVVTKLGRIESVNTRVIENLFASDLAYLQDFYCRINEGSTAGVKAVCPKCGHRFEVKVVHRGSDRLPFRAPL
ncbi:MULTISPECIES: hypothetical protein [unclassified Methanoculleus]|uniref:hypothetical protein n=1 Tax=unclassified Methanoculleus TaxID=2619537 RepID=UPI0025EE0A60|nr:MULTISPECIES: hypothetical protein [unclassified Methanoculleus]